MHELTVNERTLTPEDGLLLGNGDLSVSVYQTADRIVWRFGKNDVWDRRLDLSDDPRPAHIDEIARGIRDEGWTCGPYGGPVEATRGTQDATRMREICQGTPPSYTRRPFPCPKPVGELAMQLPPDLMGMALRQTLTIEEARLTLRATWPSGVGLEIECFVPPAPNVLVVSWTLTNWTPRNRLGPSVPPVWFSLYRWADPSIQAFAARFFGDARHGAFRAACDPKSTPLPPPAVEAGSGQAFIEQVFPADAQYTDGFRYALAPVLLAEGMAVEQVDMSGSGEARLHLLPKADTERGSLAVAITTSSDAGGAREALQRLRAEASGRPAAESVAAWAAANRTAAAEFWARSRLSVADPLLENLWYETLHARRCAYRADTPPPGLFLPSTVQDYSHWHGDYHTNYNIQEPFWGDYTANQLGLGDALFRAIDSFLPSGRRIAHDYYGCRGVFIQLSGFPGVCPDDWLGIAPMGRMAYMTGWAANAYWWRYLYTLDADWLRATGYPVIRDCALFYTDFMKKGDDGLYHVFPSNQGEDGFSGNVKDYTDRPQIMQHLRYCLRAAIQAATVLGVDQDLRGEWQERLAHTAGDDGQPPPALAGIEKECAERCPPEFAPGRPYRPQPASATGEPWPGPGVWLYDWYFGQFPWLVMRRLRAGDHLAARDHTGFRDMVSRWRHPNGLIWGMATAHYGHSGAWTESLGVIAPLQEMLLQSWDGALRVFPAWPREVAARFENLRAEGAFLVTAAWADGRAGEVMIVSEKGAPCRVYPPWPEGAVVTDSAGRRVELGTDPFGRAEFATTAGTTYRLAPAPPKP